jgi:hypothetical protein
MTRFITILAAALTLGCVTSPMDNSTTPREKSIQNPSSPLVPVPFSPTTGICPDISGRYGAWVAHCPDGFTTLRWRGNRWEVVRPWKVYHLRSAIGIILMNGDVCAVRVRLPSNPLGVVWNQSGFARFEVRTDGAVHLFDVSRVRGDCPIENASRPSSWNVYQGERDG